MGTHPDFSITTRIDIPPALLKQASTLAQPPPAKPRPKLVIRRFSPRHSAEESLSITAQCPPVLQRIYDAVVVLDRTGRVVDTNSRAQALFGHGPGDLRGMPLHRLISGADETLIERIQTTLVADKRLIIQASCRRHDDTLFAAELTGSVLDFDKMRVCLFIRDISVRRESEEMLRTCYNAIMNAGCGLAACDLQGVIMYANPSFTQMVTGNAADDVQGKNLMELFPPGATLDALLAAIGRRSESWTGELTIDRPLGAIHLQVAASCNLDTEEHFAGMVLSLTDVTDRRVAEEARRDAESQQAIVASLAATCHHIGQPATVVKSSLEMLMARLSNIDHESATLLEMAKEAADRIAVLLHKFNTASEYRLVDYLPASNGRDATKMLELPVDLHSS